MWYADIKVEAPQAWWSVTSFEDVSRVIQIYLKFTMEVPDPRLSLSAFGLNGDSGNSKSKSAAENFAYQSFENDDVAFENPGHRLRFDQLESDMENGGRTVVSDQNDQPRNRRANGFGGKTPYGNGRDEEEVEECQIRT